MAPGPVSHPFSVCVLRCVQPPRASAGQVILVHRHLSMSPSVPRGQFWLSGLGGKWLASGEWRTGTLLSPLNKQDKPPPTTKNNLAPNTTTAEAENPSLGR